MNAYYVKLELANFNAAEAHFEKIITKKTHPNWYYIDYQQGFPDFEWKFADVNCGSLGNNFRLEQLYSQGQDDDEEDDEDEDSDQEEPNVKGKVEKKEKSTTDKRRKNLLHDWRVTTLLFNLCFGALYFLILREQYTSRILGIMDVI